MLGNKRKDETENEMQLIFVGYCCGGRGCCCGELGKKSWVVVMKCRGSIPLQLPLLPLVRMGN